MQNSACKSAVEPRGLTPESLIEVFFHKLSQPIAALYGTLELGLMSDEPAEHKAALQTGVEHVERLLWLFQVTRTFFGTDFRAGAEPVSLRTCIDRAVQNTQPIAESAGVSIVVDADADATVMGNITFLAQAFENILSTTVRESRAGAAISLRTEVIGSEARVVIADQRLATAESVSNAFQPFPPGVEVAPGRASNLDLCLSRRILNFHSGDATLCLNPEGHREFTISLPVARS